LKIRDQKFKLRKSPTHELQTIDERRGENINVVRVSSDKHRGESINIVARRKDTIRRKHNVVI